MKLIHKVLFDITLSYLIFFSRFLKSAYSEIGISQTVSLDHTFEFLNNYKKELYLYNETRRKFNIFLFHSIEEFNFRYNKERKKCKVHVFY